MQTLFEMSDLGQLNYYLGIEVRQHGGGIDLCQAGYATKILDKSGMTDCNPCHVPMKSWFKLSRVSTTQPVDATEYWSIVGMLRYLVHSRPDLSSVGYVSRFMQEPTTEHMAAVKHTLRYVAETMHWEVHYSRGLDGAPLIGCSKNDLRGDIDNRRSTTGVMLFLSSNLVS